jgi:hypothetical protein
VTALIWKIAARGALNTRCTTAAAAAVCENRGGFLFFEKFSDIPFAPTIATFWIF